MRRSTPAVIAGALVAVLAILVTFVMPWIVGWAAILDRLLP